MQMNKFKIFATLNHDRLTMFAALVHIEANIGIQDSMR